VSATRPEVATQAPRQRPRWRRWLGQVVVMLLLALVGLGVRFDYRHRLAVAKLEEAVAAVDREEPGWRVKDLEASRAVVPDAENSALVLAKVRELLPQTAWNTELDTLLEGPQPCEQLRPDQVALLRSELARARPALEEARKVADLLRGRHPIAHRRPAISTQLPHLQPLRGTVTWLKLDAMLRAQDRDLRGAALSCRAAMNAARSVGDEPTTVSQLVRVACVAVVGNAVERTLAQGEAEEQELAALQQLFTEEDAHPALQVVLRAERAMIHDTLEAVENGEITLSQLDSDGRRPAPWDERVFGFYYRDRVREDHPRLFALMARRFEIAALPLHQQGDAQRAFTAEIVASTRNVVTLLLPEMNKVGEAFRRHQATSRCLELLLAIERYRLRHGAWPESLGQLTPGLLEGVPLDPFDGQPLRYRRLEDGAMVYSVGHDGVDNSGNLDRAHPTQPGVDIGFRLWDVKHRRQPPRPKEKAPEEPAALGGPPP
jgi:hypothetical protein